MKLIVIDLTLNSKKSEVESQAELQDSLVAS